MFTIPVIPRTQFLLLYIQKPTIFESVVTVMDDQNTADLEFSRIYSKTCRKIYRAAVSGTASMSDADDVFQETYVELLGQLRRGRKIRRPEHYLMTILRRILSSHYKADPVTLSTDDDSCTEHYLADELDIEDSIITDSLIEELITLLKQKDDTVRKIFYLYYSCDLTLPEIASELALPLGTVKNRLYRTLKELRAYYKEGLE